MADVYGLTPDGFFPKSTDQIVTDSQTRIRNTFSQSLPLDENTIAGQYIGIIGDAAGNLWSVLQQIYASQDPDQASGNALDALCKLTGTFRPLALPSLVNPQIITGAPGTVVAEGFTVATASTGVAFESQADATLVACAAWAVSTTYSYGDLVTNGGNVYSCIVAGESAPSGGGPSGTSESITDNTVTWAFCGVGTAAVAVEMASIDTGPMEAVAFDLTVIQTAIGGVSGTVNLLDAVLGVVVASDELLRVVREEELQNPGKSPVDAARAALLNVAGVTAVSMFYNPTDVTDSNGLPPHSMMALVTGGADQDVWNAVWANWAGGIRTWGSETGTIIDAAGNTQTVSFQRPIAIDIYVLAVVVYFANTYGGDAAVQLAIANGANANGANYNVVPNALGAMVFAGNPAAAIAGVSGILSARCYVYTDAIGTAAAWLPSHTYVATSGSRSVVTNDGGRYYICKSQTGPSAGSGGPTGTGTGIVDGGVVWDSLEATINVDAFHQAVFDTSRVNVNSTGGTP